MEHKEKVRQILKDCWIKNNPKRNDERISEIWAKIRDFTLSAKCPQTLSANKKTIGQFVTGHIIIVRKIYRLSRCPYREPDGSVPQLLSDPQQNREGVNE